VDTKEGVFGEAGDAFAAREPIRMDDVHELAKLVTEEAPGRRSDAEITLFKSVGTGLRTSQSRRSSISAPWSARSVPTLAISPT